MMNRYMDPANDRRSHEDGTVCLRTNEELEAFRQAVYALYAPILPPSSDPRSPADRYASPDYQVKRPNERPTMLDIAVLR